MSNKRWWLPTQKGTELFPQVTRSPTKLVIEGIRPDTPLYYAIAQRFGGQLKAFHGRCQQDYSLSPTQQMQRSIQFGDDARITYTNQFGQETLRLQVAGPVVEEVRKEISYDYWDFALIELYVPDMNYTEGAIRLDALAHLTTPIEAPLVGATWPVNGLATNFLTRPSADPIINAAEADDFVHTSSYDGEISYASFTVDLRPARGLSAVTVDLHALIEVQTESTPLSTWFTPGGVQTSNEEIPHDSGGNPLDLADYDLVMSASPRNPPISSLNQTGNGGTLARILTDQINGLQSGYPDYAGSTDTVEIIGGNILTYTSPLPAVHFDSGSGTYVFDATGNQFYNEFLGDRQVRIVSDTTPPLFQHEETDTGGWWRHWYIATGGSIPGYTGDNPVPAEVQVTLFKGAPSFEVGKYEGDFTTFYRWDYAQLFPVRAGFMTLGHPGISVFPSATSPYVDDPEELYGLPKLGTVVIMLRTDLGTSWQTA